MRLAETNSFHRFTQLVLLIGFLSTSCFAANQDNDSDLKSLQQQWQALQSQFGEQDARLKSGEGDLEQLEAKYQSLIEQSDLLIEKIETTAIATLNHTPHDAASIRALMGIMMHHAENGRDQKVLALGDLLIAQGINQGYFKIAARAERLPIAAREIFDELIIRQQEALNQKLPRVKLTTTQGEIVVELFESEAPNTVKNFISLVESGFYQDTLFHRVMENFMAQGGGYRLDEQGNETPDGPDYQIKCECYQPDRRQHFTGSLSMALDGKDSGNSQFFLTFKRTDHLDSKFPPDPQPAHTCFGRVIEGWDVLDALARTHIAHPGGNDEPISGVKKDKIISAEVIRGLQTPRPLIKIESAPADQNGDQAKQPDSGLKLNSPQSEPKKTQPPDDDKAKDNSDDGDLARPLPSS